MFEHFDLKAILEIEKKLLHPNHINGIDIQDYYNISKHKVTNFTAAQKFYTNRHFTFINSLYEADKGLYALHKKINSNCSHCYLDKEFERIFKVYRVPPRYFN